ncbi:uncharacterized protein LOC110978878 isoform X2 [Acanthaster planci]|uniref:Uncharacterized protein LOC110978878 isoform X2 n=1 Tax=Acanthaster planci TaxID=133434 RepID=A0A8B7YE27_ACAPL|nr:uncharacterized protein LOC110978878 isoform X2 [Acanthaster planci]
MSSAEEFDPKQPQSAPEVADNESTSETRETNDFHSTIDSLTKRKATPFTSTMDVALATAYTTEKNILDGTFREHGVPTRQQKQAAWERIRDCVNAFSGENNVKTVQQCKDRHRNLIQAVRFKRSSGFLEGPLPLPGNIQSQEMIDQQGEASHQELNEKDRTEEVQTNQQELHHVEPANGLSLKEKRPLKRPSSSSADSLDEYHKRKLAILVKEHIVRVELMKAQTEYYRTKTELMVKHSCSRPASLPVNPPSKHSSSHLHLHPNLPGKT